MDALLKLCASVRVCVLVFDNMCLFVCAVFVKRPRRRTSPTTAAEAQVGTTTAAEAQVGTTTAAEAQVGTTTAVSVYAC